MQCKFVEQSKGEFTAEDKREIVYNNVTISDGIRAISLKYTGTEELSGLKEGDACIASFKIGKGNEGKGTLVITSLVAEGVILGKQKSEPVKVG